MRPWLPVIAAALQVLVLGYMAGEREAVAAHGTRIWLRTAPVDPRDLFRGDYVRLRYEASTVPRERWGGTLAQRKVKRGERVYAVLAPRADGLYEVQTLTDTRPDNGLFLRGRIESCWGDRALDVRYGIEAYFMQQGTARTVEQERNRDGVQIPLDMEVAVGSHGIAVLGTHRPAPLGLGVVFETAPDTRQRTGKLSVRLLNASPAPLAIVDVPKGRSLALVPDRPLWQPAEPTTWRWAHADDALPSPTEQDVHVIEPGATYAIDVDLRDPAWFVIKQGEAQPRALPGVEDWSAVFRLVYRAPSPEACAGLAQTSLIWHGELRSSSFNGRNRVD
jgi:uncharacterized membrane-anchored protein